MKNVYIVANWKANKKESETESWFDEFKTNIGEIDYDNIQIIICPPYVLLSSARKSIDNNRLGISLGSQDISFFPEGPYTGEIPYLTLADMVDYCIIGHSERRKNFNETDDILKQKVSNAVSGSITPIFCVQGEDTFIPQNVTIVAYEPIEAIGTGNPDTPENADKVAGAIKEKNKNVEAVLYGGSVNSENVASFIKKDNIDGVLVGGASLDAYSFCSIIKNGKEN